METSPVTYGPELERSCLTVGLDYYKPTMSQFAYEHEPEAEVTFTFKNRGEQRLLDYVNAAELQERLDTIQVRGFNDGELEYLASVPHSQMGLVFENGFLNYLEQNELPPVHVHVEDGVMAIETSGAWDLVTFWETVVMSQVNELYFESYIRTNGLDIMEIYDEGDRRLTEKIRVLQKNPDIKLADFGTRRHFSYKWQKHVVQRLQQECPQNLLGTSNVALARELDLKPIGTFAHELPMVYAGLADGRGWNVRGSHSRLLEDWYNYYGDDLSIALTDTFGSDFFFTDFTAEQARTWKGLRHDSGDPAEFGEKAIAFYEANNVDPQTKTIVFSDGVDIEEILRLYEIFKDRVNVVFGWGTTLTNDLGLKPLNIVMKATRANGTPTVKLSDNSGKHTGPAEKFQHYQQVFTARQEASV